MISMEMKQEKLHFWADFGNCSNLNNNLLLEFLNGFFGALTKLLFSKTYSFQVAVMATLKRSVLNGQDVKLVSQEHAYGAEVS